jgi:bacillithiol biosynthesis deacetylase BshB1
MASILVVGPHPDDQELGMGGTIARLASQGHTITLLDMTDGEPTPHGDPVTRAKEAMVAARVLGGGVDAKIRRIQLGLRNRFVEHSIENRHKVAGVMRAVQAKIVFVPYFEDAHPDHLAVTRIVEDARFDAKLTKLEMPGDQGRPPIYPTWLFHYYATHLRIVPQPSFLIDITGFEQVKRDAILAYHSQFVANAKNQGVVDWMDAAGRYFGSRIGAAAAEPFFAREPIGLNGLVGLAGIDEPGTK